MTQTDEIRQVQEAARSIRQNVGRVIIGKEEVIDLLMVALLCEGHVLFEDVPGIGKTTLAKSLAKSLGCSFQRIQFTPDILPSDAERSSDELGAGFSAAPRLSERAPQHYCEAVVVRRIRWAL